MLKKSLSKTSSATMADTLAMARSRGLLSSEDNSAFFVDMDILDDRLDHLSRVFPEGTLHAIPVKTHPLIHTLKHIAQRGFGAEAASIEEMQIAHAAGFASQKMVWDSPVKTDAEIRYCCKHFAGAYVNANNLQELSRFPSASGLRLGLRINPMQSSGAPSLFDVSGAYSKFGEPISNRQRIIDTYLDRSDLCGIHIHSGSDIGNLVGNVDLIAEVAALSLEINQERSHVGMAPLEFFDIGGGATAPLDESPVHGISEYAEKIKSRLDIAEEFKLVTEFGRFTYAHCGWMWSKIESITNYTDQRGLLYIHLGADAFVRETYVPSSPRHEISVLSKAERPEPTITKTYDIAGPLCFAGDYLARGVVLPEVNQGDHLVVHNTGANTFALWSRHCSRRFPKIISYSQKRDEMVISKDKESMQSVLAFWGGN